MNYTVDKIESINLKTQRKRRVKKSKGKKKRKIKAKQEYLKICDFDKGESHKTHNVNWGKIVFFEKKKNKGLVMKIFTNFVHDDEDRL